MVITDIGEYLVGAYLQIVEKCDFIDYNVRPPGGGLEGPGELDVVGLNFVTKTAYLCEVTTHIRGLLYISNKETVSRLAKKNNRQRSCAAKYLQNFGSHHFQFWSPVVPVGYITDGLAKIIGLELVINGEYKRRVEKLQELARIETHDTKNPVFRVFQILARLRE